MSTVQTSRPAVLAHLTLKLVSQRENFATEALAYVLNSSAVARAALQKRIAGAVADFPTIVRVSTQEAAGDESRPDVTLMGDGGAVLGYIEAKFWASLTNAQPVGYVRRLSPGAGKVIMFLVPDRRLQMLRGELIERCEAEKLVVERVTGSHDIIADAVRITAVSWQALLAELSDAARRTDDRAVLADVDQIASLCAAFDTQGYIPLTHEELDDLDVPRRVMSLADLAIAVGERAEAEGVVKIGRLRASHTWYTAGRYVSFERAGAWIGLSHRRWFEFGHPLWVRFEKGDWGRADDVRRAIEGKFTEDPCRAFIVDDGAVIVPLIVRAGASKDDAVAHGVGQLKELAAAMEKAGMPGLSATAPSADADQ